VYSDSSYLVNAIERGWLKNWQRNNWRTSNKEPVKNKDLWMLLLDLLENHDVSFIKVRGHLDDALNNRCDSLATGQIKLHSS
jgi:ribonuclease HI